MKTMKTQLKGLQGTNKADLYTHTHTHTHLIFEKQEFARRANYIGHCKGVSPSLSFSGLTRELSGLCHPERSEGSYTRFLGRCPQNDVMTQSGRTLLETMAVLAIMGILSVAAYYTFRVLMEKHTANTILEDAQVAFIEIHSKSEGVPSVWEEVTQKFKPVSEALGFYVKRDPLGQDYVKVTNVEQRVCYQLLNMQLKGKVAFYDENDEKYTSCSATNNMILAFNGQPAPAECATTTHCDGLGDYGEEGFPGYCNSTGHCHQCDTTYEEVNYDRTGCTCLKDKGLNCTNDRGAHWCCGEGLICGEDANTCVDGGGICSYRFYGPSEPDTTYMTECSYSISGIANIDSYTSDCYYTIGATPALTEKKIGEEKKNLAEPVMTSNGTRGGCPANKYCALLWTDKADGSEDGNWASTPADVSANYVGRIYGKCQMMSSYDKTPKANYSEGSGLVYASGGVRGGCPENKYCALLWSQETWTGEEPKLRADAAGFLYGKCLTLSSYDQTPIVDTSVSTSSQYRVLQGCPVNQYCYLKWQEDSCTDHGASDTGIFAGACIGMGTNNPSCPYNAE